MPEKNLFGALTLGALVMMASCTDDPTMRGAQAVTDPSQSEAVTEEGASACPHGGHCDHAAVGADGPQPSAVLADGSRQFGAALTDMPLTPLSEITSSPESYADQTVRTEGTIARVCQRMGCWMELSADGAAPVRVPMAGHSFFLPRDVSGRPATIEGRVALATLSPEQRAHLESEGAEATMAALSIEATSVVVR